MFWCLNSLERKSVDFTSSSFNDFTVFSDCGLEGYAAVHLGEWVESKKEEKVEDETCGCLGIHNRDGLQIVK